MFATCLMKSLFPLSWLVLSSASSGIMVCAVGLSLFQGKSLVRYSDKNNHEEDYNTRIEYAKHDKFYA